jgi:serine phosphatase RsbU (regulator of sigma subunit)
VNFKKVIFFLLVVCYKTNYAYNIYLLQNDKPSQEIKLSHFCDTSGRFSINQIQTLDFKKFNTGAVNLAYTPYNHWFAFSYYASEPDNDFFLHIENPLLDSIEAYFVQDGILLEKIIFGDHYLYKNRNYDFPELILKLPIKNNKVVDVYFKMKCEISLLSPIKIYNEPTLVSKLNEISWGLGIYYGALLVIFFYSLFIYLSLKDKAYLYYVLYLLSYGLSLSNFDGFMFKYALSNYPMINNLALYFFIYFATIFGTLFAVSFLDLKKTWYLGYRIITTFLIPVVISVILLFIYPNIIFHDIVASVFAAFISFIGIVIGFVSWKKGYSSARFYSIAYTFVLTSVIIYVCKDLGLLSSNIFTEYVMHFGSGIEMILLSLGLADKYNKLKVSNEIAQTKLIDNLKEIQILQNITNQELEEKVAVRTKQLNEQNITLEEKQKEILDSIAYAKRLQEAILPSQNFVNKHLPESFVLYKPKDIVAGDFYWMHVFTDEITNKEITLIAAADCTGHGVPGALVSVVCSNALNRTVTEFKIFEPSKILDKVRELVIETFERSDYDVKDGMDISLCSITKNGEDYSIKWSGANNSLWYITPSFNINNKESSVTLLSEIKANKQPIGKTDTPKPFTQHQITLNKNDVIYLFTDGFADQFGGPKGKKLKSLAMKELLTSISHKSMTTQKIEIEAFFNNWKKDLEQVDDVCVIGIRL